MILLAVLAQASQDGDIEMVDTPIGEVRVTTIQRTCAADEVFIGAISSFTSETFVDTTGSVKAQSVRTHLTMSTEVTLHGDATESHIVTIPGGRVESEGIEMVPSDTARFPVAEVGRRYAIAYSTEGANTFVASAFIDSAVTLPQDLRHQFAAFCEAYRN